MVYGDPNRLQQVLFNLIRNAIDSSFRNGEILINLNYDYRENKLICIIYDNGLGIKKSDQKTIFNLLQLYESNININEPQIEANMNQGRMGLGLCLS
jgi:signal transduction histidine kinase